MKHKIIISGIILILLTVMFCGCFEENTEESKFVGTWRHGTLPSGGAIEFRSNGKCLYGRDPGDWKLKDDKLIITLDDQNITVTFQYEFQENNKVLVLIDQDNGRINDYIKEE
jgi:hypothetical protein